MSRHSLKKLGKGTGPVLENNWHAHSFADYIVIEKFYLNLSACKQALPTDTRSELV